MPDLTREEVKRGLAYIEAHEYLKARGALSDKLPTQYEALQTALSLFDRAEQTAAAERVKAMERVCEAAKDAVEYADHNCGPCNANGIVYPHMVCDECWAANIQALLGDALAALDALKEANDA